MKPLYLGIYVLFLFCSESFCQSVTGVINDVRCDLKCTKLNDRYLCAVTFSWTYSLRSSKPRAKAPHFNYYILLTGDDGKRTMKKIFYDPIDARWCINDAIHRTSLVDDEKHSLNMPDMIIGNLKESLLRNVVVRLVAAPESSGFTDRQTILLTRAEIWQDGKLIVYKNMYTPLHVIKADVPEDWWVIGKYSDKMSY